MAGRRKRPVDAGAPEDYTPTDEEKAQLNPGEVETTILYERAPASRVSRDETTEKSKQQAGLMDAIAQHIRTAGIDNTIYVRTANKASTGNNNCKTMTWIPEDGMAKYPLCNCDVAPMIDFQEYAKAQIGKPDAGSETCRLACRIVLAKASATYAVPAASTYTPATVWAQAARVKFVCQALATRACTKPHTDSKDYPISGIGRGLTALELRPHTNVTSKQRIQANRMTPSDCVDGFIAAMRDGIVKVSANATCALAGLHVSRSPERVAETVYGTGIGIRRPVTCTAKRVVPVVLDEIRRLLLIVSKNTVAIESMIHDLVETDRESHLCGHVDAVYKCVESARQKKACADMQEWLGRATNNEARYTNALERLIAQLYQQTIHERGVFTWTHRYDRISTHRQGVAPTRIGKYAQRLAVIADSELDANIPILASDSQAMAPMVLDGAFAIPQELVRADLLQGVAKPQHSEYTRVLSTVLGMSNTNGDEFSDGDLLYDTIDEDGGVLRVLLKRACAVQTLRKSAPYELPVYDLPQTPITIDIVMDTHGYIVKCWDHIVVEVKGQQGPKLPRKDVATLWNINKRPEGPDKSAIIERRPGGNLTPKMLEYMSRDWTANGTMCAVLGQYGNKMLTIPYVSQNKFSQTDQYSHINPDLEYVATPPPPPPATEEDIYELVGSMCMWARRMSTNPKSEFTDGFQRISSTVEMQPDCCWVYNPKNDAFMGPCSIKQVSHLMAVVEHQKKVFMVPRSCVRFPSEFHPIYTTDKTAVDCVVVAAKANYTTFYVINAPQSIRNNTTPYMGGTSGGPFWTTAVKTEEKIETIGHYLYGEARWNVIQTKFGDIPAEDDEDQPHIRTETDFKSADFTSEIHREPRDMTYPTPNPEQAVDPDRYSPSGMNVYVMVADNANSVRTGLPSGTRWAGPFYYKKQTQEIGGPHVVATKIEMSLHVNDDASVQAPFFWDATIHGEIREITDKVQHFADQDGIVKTVYFDENSDILLSAPAWKPLTATKYHDGTDKLVAGEICKEAIAIYATQQPDGYTRYNHLVEWSDTGSERILAVRKLVYKNNQITLADDSEWTCITLYTSHCFTVAAATISKPKDSDLAAYSEKYIGAKLCMPDTTHGKDVYGMPTLCKTNIPQDTEIDDHARCYEYVVYPANTWPPDGAVYTIACIKDIMSAHKIGTYTAYDLRDAASVNDEQPIVVDCAIFFMRTGEDIGGDMRKGSRCNILVYADQRQPTEDEISVEASRYMYTVDTKPVYLKKKEDAERFGTTDTERIQYHNTYSRVEHTMDAADVYSSGHTPMDADFSNSPAVAGPAEEPQSPDISLPAFLDLQDSPVGPVNTVAQQPQGPAPGLPAQPTRTSSRVHKPPKWREKDTKDDMPDRIRTIRTGKKVPIPKITAEEKAWETLKLLRPRIETYTTKDAFLAMSTCIEFARKKPSYVDIVERFCRKAKKAAKPDEYEKLMRNANEQDNLDKTAHRDDEDDSE